MTEQEIKNNFAKNLSTLRKAQHLTQLQLAEKLNYSDKSVSKWEHGDVLPDVTTISLIAEYFGVSIDELIGKKQIKKAPKTNMHLFILALSCALTLFISCIIFWILSSLNVNHVWLVFIYGVTAASIVAIVLCAIWFSSTVTAIAVSALTWSLGVSLHLTALMFFGWTHSWFVYIVCAVFQVLIGLWFAFRKYLKRKKRV